MIGDQAPPPPPEREKLIANETAKLLATTVNNLATAFLVGGVVAPLIGLGGTTPGVGQIVLRLVWLLAGVSLHLVARLVLRGLRP